MTQLTTNKPKRAQDNRSVRVLENDKQKPGLIHNRLLPTKTMQLASDGLGIRYAELGDPTNPTVVLLHGVPENLQGWYAVAPLLTENYHVLAIDWPGFGASTPLPSPKDYTSRRFAQVIVDFLDSLDIEQANLVATDIGMLPSLLVGLKYPDRVSKLVVMDGITANSCNAGLSEISLWSSV